MARYRKKPVVVEATQWFENGDHPEDDCGTFDAGDGPFQGEGNVVRYFRRPDVDGQRKCEKCGYIMDAHGWIDTLGEGIPVCPGDWIITEEGEYRTCEPFRFPETHEIVEEWRADREAVCISSRVTACDMGDWRVLVVIAADAVRSCDVISEREIYLGRAEIAKLAAKFPIEEAVRCEGSR